MSDKMYIPGKVLSVSSSTRGNYNGVELKYTTHKTGTEITDFIFATTLKAKPNLAETLKSLKEGQDIKVQKEKKGKYSNVVAIYTGDQATTKTSETRSSNSNVDFNTRAARGQALNLAVSVAVAEGKQDDDKFILSQVGRFLKLGELVQQGVSPESAAKLETGLKEAKEGKTKKVDLEDFFA